MLFIKCSRNSDLAFQYAERLMRYTLIWYTSEDETFLLFFA